MVFSMEVQVEFWMELWMELSMQVEAERGMGLCGPSSVEVREIGPGSFYWETRLQQPNTLVYKVRACKQSRACLRRSSYSFLTILS